MASQCIYIKPESLQNHSFHLGSRSSRTPPRSQRRDQTVYIISAPLSLSILNSIRLATPVDQSYQRHYRYMYRNFESTRRNCAIHIPIYSRNLEIKEHSLPTPTINCSTSRNPTAPQPAVKPQTTSTCCAVTVTKEHLLCSRYDCSCREIRFRMIPPISSLMNRRGNNLHTVDVCW